MLLWATANMTWFTIECGDIIQEIRFTWLPAKFRWNSNQPIECHSCCLNFLFWWLNPPFDLRNVPICAAFIPWFPVRYERENSLFCAKCGSLRTEAPGAESIRCKSPWLVPSPFFGRSMAVYHIIPDWWFGTWLLFFHMGMGQNPGT